MDEQKRKLLSRLTNLRALMLKEYPFFGELMMMLRFGVADCETAYTDMKHIVFDPDFAGRLSDEELKFVFMHEVMHCVLKHCVRGEGLISEIYNIACDIVVNSNILYYMGQSDIKIDGVYAMHRTPNGEEGYRYSAEDVYRMLLIQGNGGNGGSRERGNESKQIDSRNTNTGRIDTHEIWSRTEVNEAVTGQWDKAVKEYGGKGYSPDSFMPPAVRGLLDDWLQNRQVNWKELLYDYIRMVYDSSDYSFSPPDRRFSDYDYILPDDHPELTEQLRDIWFCVDTSGSISREELSEICGEIANIYHEITKVEGMISFFDTRVTEPVEFSCREELMEMKPVGGGGTSFVRIFRYLDQNMRDHLPAAIVILTDGYAEMPEESMALGVPVIWLLLKEHEDMPWGKSVRIR